jgi:tRNA threonylcarbamoyl adenosine modification protein YeaZ
MSAPTSDRAWLLAFDASTPRCVAALGWIRGDASALVTGQVVAEQPSQASARLAVVLAEMLADAAVDAATLGAVASGRGPGTFTGTRVALATAMGIAVGVGCSAIALSTLEVVGASHGGTGDVLALLDARRGEVYAARTRVVGSDDCNPPTVTTVGPEACVAPSAWLDAQGDVTDLPAFGPGVAPWHDLLHARGVRARPSSGPTPEGLWHATVSAWRRGDAGDPERLRAVYLRPSYAELGVNQPKRAYVKSPFV